MIRNKETLQWFKDSNVTQAQLEEYLLYSNPDCREATIICGFAVHALSIIEGLEQELDIYRKHAEHCKL